MPKRTVADIERYTVHTAYPGVDGWVILLRYHDGKMVTFSIDAPERQDILQVVTDCIKRVLRESK